MWEDKSGGERAVGFKPITCAILNEKRFGPFCIINYLDFT